MRHQHSILAPVPAAGRFVVLGLRAGADVGSALASIARLRVDDSLVVGLGEPIVRGAGASVPGLRSFPAFSSTSIVLPSTQGAVWLFAAGTDAGEALHRARRAIDALGPAFVIDEEVEAFRYAGGRDLSGYEDGTENPQGERAVETAIVDPSGGSSLAGSSFVAVQRWSHDLGELERLTPAARDALVGRHRDTNEELPDAPASAHVKRSAQEDFEPPAFLVRRSMPWGNVRELGLFFVAYAATLDAFERVMRRMIGTDDGVVDGLFRFSRALSGGYYWCPPAQNGVLDLAALAAAPP